MDSWPTQREEWEDFELSPIWGHTLHELIGLRSENKNPTASRDASELHLLG